jgi:hypothetical protein
MLTEETVVLWVTGPSSPGLSTRTEIEMLQPEQVAGSGGAAVSPQLQFQFQVDPGADAGAGDIVPVESSAQFQFQFHTQFCGSTGSCVGCWLP